MNFLKYFLVLALLIVPFFATSEDNEIVFHKTSDTLAKIRDVISKKEKGAYLRFGDGDVNLALGLDDSYQQSNSRLQGEMELTFGLNDSNVLKCLPLYCRELNAWENGMFPGNHESTYNFSKQILNKVSGLWGGKITDVYSHVALHFSATSNQEKCIEFLKFIRSSNCAVLVGNENIPNKIRQLLFSENCQFIPTPFKQSYDEIDRIEEDCLNLLENNQEYKIVVTSMGCSGRVLQKRLWDKLDNVFLFDFGSLMDALCGWNTRAWIELSHFDKDLFIQALSQSLKEEQEQQNYLTSVSFESSMTNWAGYNSQRADWRFLKTIYESFQDSFSLAEDVVIPKLIHFIWLGSPLPDRCQKMIESWKKFHPEWTIKVWSEEEAASYPFINRLAFESAKNYGEKADIWRYELLYKFGGLYSDTDFECLKPFDDLHKSTEFYTGIGQGSNPDLLIGIIGSIPGHPILRAVIENLRVGNGDHDSERIMNDTGPYYFTRMFTAIAPLCDPGTVVALPVTFFYPFPGAQRHRSDIINIKREFIKPESMAVHYFSTSWQK